MDSRPIDPGAEPDLARVLTIGAWCNNAQVSPGEDGAEGWQVLGDPTEGALLIAARKAGIVAETASTGSSTRSPSTPSGRRCRSWSASRATPS